jgi:hypothetical protein
MSTETQNKDDDKIVVNEGQDGSAVIELPDHIQGDQQDEDDDHDEAHAAGGEVDSAGDEVAPPDETEYQRARREKRRAKREFAKRNNAEKDVKLQMLERKNQELMERLMVVEKKHHASDLAQLDKAIEDQEMRLQYAKMKLSEATTARDGEALTKAQDMWYESRRKIEQLQGFKKQVVRPQNEGSIAPDPRVARNVNLWMERNPWFNADLGDVDSQIAKKLDEALTNEGFDPADAGYFKELDKRLRNYMPHRYNQDTERSDNSGKPRRNIVGDSGREFSSGGSNRNTFTLTKEQVSAMKEAGFWDDAEKRNKMIKRYAMEARQQYSKG